MNENVRAIATDIPIIGGSLPAERNVRQCLGRYPTWFVRAARVSRIIFSNAPEVRDQIAMFEHGTRDLYMWQGVGVLMQKALGHELFHAVDDNFGADHFFTSTPEWIRIHREQSHFDIPKYGEQPLEYFADMGTKCFLLGPDKLRTTNPNEVTYITSFVFPTLQKEFDT